jgi:hypothetical protein
MSPSRAAAAVANQWILLSCILASAAGASALGGRGAAVRPTAPGHSATSTNL